MKNNRSLSYIIFFLFPFFILTGCIATAAARNDFSQMGNDVFSKLVKDSIRENFGHYGYEGINQAKIMEQGKNLFIGKIEDEILSVFMVSGGRCVSADSSNSRGVEEPLVCEISKKWRLKNVGHPYFDIVKDIPEYWPVPGEIGRAHV